MEYVNKIEPKFVYILERIRPTRQRYEHEQQLSEKPFNFTQVNMSALRDLANVALAQYTKIYDEVIAEQEITGAPSGDKLFNWMKAKLYECEDQDVEKPVKFSVPEAKSLPREDDEVPVIEEKTGTKTPAKKTKPQQPAVTEGKLSSKVLKSKPIVYKTKNDAGEETENSVELPYLPCCVDYTGTCQALKVNGGLFTPCLTRPAKNSEFCKICEKQGFKYGKIEDRNGMPVSCYVDPNEKKEISFGTYLQKRDIPREAVDQLIKETFGDEIQIPEHYWNVDKVKGKRAVKKTKSVSASSDVVSSTEEESVSEPVETTTKPTEKKEQKQRGRPKKVQNSDETAATEEAPKQKGKRGRPKKVQKEVEDVIEPEASESSEGWINGLVEEEESSEKVPEPKKKEEKKVAPPPAPIEEKKKVAPPPASIEEEENEVEEQEEENEVEEEENEVEEEENEEEEDHSRHTQRSDDAEDGITYFSYNGKRYGYDEENTLFVVEKNDDVEIAGTWDPETKKPIFSEG